MNQSSLYDEDILAWSEQQAEIIRMLARTRCDLPNELDCENVAEEIESVGRDQVTAVESFLRMVLVHLIKIASAPDSDPAQHWADEALNFHTEAVARMSPSMPKRIDVARVWHLAVKQARASLERHGDRMVALPEACPFDLEELLREDIDIDRVAARLREPGSAA